MKESPKVPRPKMAMKCGKVINLVLWIPQNRRDIGRPRGSKWFRQSPGRCHTTSDMRAVEEREKHAYRMGNHRATQSPNMSDHHRIWAAQIDGRDAIQWMTGFDKVKWQSYIRFEVQYGRCVGRDSCFTGIREVNGQNGRSNISSEPDTPICYRIGGHLPVRRYTVMIKHNRGIQTDRGR